MPGPFFGSGLNPAHPLNAGRTLFLYPQPGKIGGPNWYDLVGGYQGSINSAAGASWDTAAPPGFAGSIHLPGGSSSSAYVTAALPALPLTTHSATLSAWFRWDSSLGAITSSQWFLGAVIGAGQSVAVTPQGGLWRAQSYLPAPTLTSGHWYMAAFVVSGALSEMYYYLCDASNGTIQQFVAGSINPSGNSSASATWFVGNNANSPHTPWPGNIASASLWWGRDLTPADIAQEFLLGMAGYPGVVSATRLANTFIPPNITSAPGTPAALAAAPSKISGSGVAGCTPQQTGAAFAGQLALAQAYTQAPMLSCGVASAATQATVSAGCAPGLIPASFAMAGQLGPATEFTPTFPAPAIPAGFAAAANPAIASAVSVAAGIPASIAAGVQLIATPPPQVLPAHLSFAAELAAATVSQFPRCLTASLAFAAPPVTAAGGSDNKPGLLVAAIGTAAMQSAPSAAANASGIPAGVALAAELAAATGGASPACTAASIAFAALQSPATGTFAAAGLPAGVAFAAETMAPQVAGAGVSAVGAVAFAATQVSGAAIAVAPGLSGAVAASGSSIAGSGSASAPGIPASLAFAAVVSPSGGAQTANLFAAAFASAGIPATATGTAAGTPATASFAAAAQAILAGTSAVAALLPAAVALSAAPIPSALGWSGVGTIAFRAQYITFNTCPCGC